MSNVFTVDEASDFILRRLGFWMDPGREHHPIVSAPHKALMGRQMHFARGGHKILVREGLSRDWDLALVVYEDAFSAHPSCVEVEFKSTRLVRARILAHSTHLTDSVVYVLERSNKLSPFTSDGMLNALERTIISGQSLRPASFGDD